MKGSDFASVNLGSLEILARRLLACGAYIRNPFFLAGFDCSVARGEGDTTTPPSIRTTADHEVLKRLGWLVGVKRCTYQWWCETAAALSLVFTENPESIKKKSKFSKKKIAG